MIPEERKSSILDYINDKKAVTATELMEVFGASEATIRRDLTEMDKKGLISKVHGGAVSIQSQILTDNNMSEREEKNREEKIAIAKYAASLISSDDVVYLDAGTTTSYIIEYINAPGARFVTNAVVHAQRLAAKGYSVYLTGGHLKARTEALVGGDCYEVLQKFHFTLAFVGTNAVNHSDGFTTPDPEEAKIKECAIKHAHSPYILCDHSKFSLTASVTFAKFEDACIITSGRIPKSYQNDKTIVNLNPNG